MLESDTDKNMISHEVQRQFLRRTPIKLKQFSRLLNDMVEQNIDDLRIKALLSQVTKTREACLAQEFESTARLLNQLHKQLSLGGDSLQSQRPLLKRLSTKLLQHSEKLELGVKPQKETPMAPPIAADNQTQELEDENLEDDEEENTEEYGLYIDKGKLVFVKDENGQNEALCSQFDSLGVESCTIDGLDSALELAKSHDGSVVVAPLSFAEPKKVLPDESIEGDLVPLIFSADEDNQENRALAVRNGGTGFVVEPVSISMLCEQVERLYDLHADTPRRILVMEDSKAQAKYYEKVLNKGHFEIRVVNDPAGLLEALRGFEPETILMDMQMPNSSGIELTQIIRQMPRYAHLPIIFLSAEENTRKQNQALMSGGTAFIVKPVQKEQLMFMANLYTQRFRDLNPQIDVNPDTNLPFSTKFKQMIAVETARNTRNPSLLALAILHLDEAKALEPTENYSFISSAVQQLAQLLRKRLRKTDIIGHLDDDRLGVILTSGKQKDWMTIMGTIKEQFASLPFHHQHQDKPMTVSIGLSELSSNYNAHQWLERSSSALTIALEKGPSSLQWYEKT